MVQVQDVDAVLRPFAAASVDAVLRPFAAASFDAVLRPFAAALFGLGLGLVDVKITCRDVNDNSTLTSTPTPALLASVFDGTCSVR